MGAVLNVGLAMRWLRDTVLAERGEGAYERMTALAAEAPPGADGLLFLPYLAGERTPHMDPTARGAFLGLTAAHNRSHLVRAVMEGATLACADAYAVLRAAAPAPKRVILAGGGARSLLWQQIVADVLGVPVARLLTGEQSARGAALLAGEAVGILDAAEASRRWAAWGEPLAPDPATQARYQELLGLYRMAYVQNRTLFHALAAFAQSGSS
ncbi:MAG: FGGY-family carbohydrate kinase, partial [Caldilineaceae bacterium]